MLSLLVKPKSASLLTTRVNKLLKDLILSDIYALRKLSSVKTPLLGNAIPVLGGGTKMGERILIIFQDRPMFSNINGKLSTRPFELYG